MARPSPHEHAPLRVAVARFLRPLASGDFAWVIYTRTLIRAGIYCLEHLDEMRAEVGLEPLYLYLERGKRMDKRGDQASPWTPPT
jgi:hypothetical protein